MRYNYPEELSIPFPAFATWLYEHVRTLRFENQFPISRELLWLSYPASENIVMYNSMWAYGCEYRYDAESGPSHVTYDSGVASVTGGNLNSAVDIRILKSIVMVTYGGTNVCLMKCSWMAPVSEGQRTIRRDGNGFWTLKFDSRLDDRRNNPYVFPSTVSQVKSTTES